VKQPRGFALPIAPHGCSITDSAARLLPGRESATRTERCLTPGPWFSASWSRQDHPVARQEGAGLAGKETRTGQTVDFRQRIGPNT